MDDEQITRLEQLLVLFRDREQLEMEASSRILDFLRDPLIEVICELLNCTPDDLSWRSVDVSSPLLILQFIAIYNDPSDIPSFMNEIAPPSEDQLRRTVNIGIPLIYAVSSREDLKEFLTATIDKALDKVHNSKDNDGSVAELTTEQQLQALLFSKHTKGVIH